ncbi:MAG: fibrobacter succinogenes major paralogous domain-containing protein [Prolixibacteraceae bacterium]|nr:fibrobacter succinogenes major paralogous domain-containing protein [Prolixibacteraceae bacterium]
MAQSPDRISYQSVIRDNTGKLVRSKTVRIKISILQGSETGTVVYAESHKLTTNINGLATLEIGDGTPESGSFPSIDWSNKPYFLKTETDPDGGYSYTVTGTTEILSVPYALYAKNVEFEEQTLSDVVTNGNEANGQLKNVTDPTDDQDAATKAYVDILLEEIEYLKNLTGVSSFTDSRDGKTYQTIRIGGQIWMAENLAYLPSVNPPDEESVTDPYYYVYGYDGASVSAAKVAENYQTYGVLYNWPAATTACPSADGWHLPTDAEWTTLTDYLENNGYGYGGSGDDIGKAFAATSQWAFSATPGDVGNDITTNNSSGFSALPGGYRYLSGDFLSLGDFGYWWSGTEFDSSNAWYRPLYYYHSEVYRTNGTHDYGFSVRCVKD